MNYTKKEYAVPDLQMLEFECSTIVSTSITSYDGITPDANNPDDVINRW